MTIVVNKLPRRKTPAPITHGIKVGDILTSTWGYSMQIVDFYKVTKVTPKTLTLTEIGAKENTQTGFLRGTVMPDPDHIKTEIVWNVPYDGVGPRPTRPVTFKRFINENGYGICADRNGHSVCHKWDGKPRHYDHCD